MKLRAAMEAVDMRHKTNCFYIQALALTGKTAKAEKLLDVAGRDEVFMKDCTPWIDRYRNRLDRIRKKGR